VTASPSSASSPTAAATRLASSSFVLPANAVACPRTIGTEGPPQAERGLFGWSSSHGNGKLWVGGLWPEGVITAEPSFVEADGSVGMKFGWWREVSGRLVITGRRLDGQAAPARGDVPDGYGQTGFQASGVVFPTEGCWEITGTVGEVRLTFVTFVRKA